MFIPKTSIFFLRVCLIGQASLLPLVAQTEPAGDKAAPAAPAAAVPAVRTHPLYEAQRGADEPGFVWVQWGPGAWRKVPQGSPMVSAVAASPKAELQGLLSQAQADSLRASAEMAIAPQKDEAGKILPVTPDILPVKLPEPTPYQDRFEYLTNAKHCLLIPKTSVLFVPEGVKSRLSSFDAEAAAEPKKEVVEGFPGPFQTSVKTVEVKLAESGIGFVYPAAEVARNRSNTAILVATYQGVPVEMPVTLTD